MIHIRMAIPIPVGTEADVECACFHSSLVMHVSYIVLKSRTQIHASVINTKRYVHGTWYFVVHYVMMCVSGCVFFLSPSKASSHP